MVGNGRNSMMRLDIERECRVDNVEKENTNNHDETMLQIGR